MNLLEAKPKHNSGMDASDIGRWLTGRTKHPEITDETGRLALPPLRDVSSTPIQERKQPRMVITAKSNRKQRQEQRSNHQMSWMLLHLSKLR